MTYGLTDTDVSEITTGNIAMIHRSRSTREEGEGERENNYIAYTFRGPYCPISC